MKMAWGHDDDQKKGRVSAKVGCCSGVREKCKKYFFRPVDCFLFFVSTLLFLYGSTVKHDLLVFLLFSPSPNDFPMFRWLRAETIRERPSTSTF